MRYLRWIVFPVIVASCMLWISFDVAAKQQGGLIKTFDYPDALHTQVSELNARGEIVGGFFPAGGPWHPFLRTKRGEYVDLTAYIPGATMGRAFGSNASGDIVGQCGGPEIGPRFFLMEGNGDVQFFEFPGVPWQGANDVNAAGDVVGFYGEEGDHLATWGWTEHGYLRTRHGEYFTVDFPGAILTNVRGINESGDMVGLYAPDDPNGPYYGFLYRQGEFISLEDYFDTANGINPQGQIVGSSLGQVGILDLDRDTFTTFDVPGVLIEAWKINPSGFVSGFYRGDDGLVHGFVRAPER